jgi:hypothetical protein
MSAKESKAIFGRYVEEAWAKGVWRWQTTFSVTGTSPTSPTLAHWSAVPRTSSNSSAGTASPSRSADHHRRRGSRGGQGGDPLVVPRYPPTAPCSEVGP